MREGSHGTRAGRYRQRSQYVERTTSSRGPESARAAGRDEAAALHQTSGRRRGAAVSLIVLVLAFVGGDAAMFGVVGLTRYLYDGPLILQWMIATPIIAFGAYFIFGLPQILAWSNDRGPRVDSADIRARFAVGQLQAGGQVAFVVASLIGGPLATGWYYGKNQHPRARNLTMTSSWILAAAWAAVYLSIATKAFR